MRNEEKDLSCEPNAFIGLDGYSGSRGIGGKREERAENEATKKGKGIESKSKCIVSETARNEKSILSLEMPATNCPARDKILDVVRNSARESRPRRGRESFEGRHEYLCNIAGFLDFRAPSFFRCNRKNNEVRVIRTASSWFNIRINVAAVGSGKI